MIDIPKPLPWFRGFAIKGKEYSMLLFPQGLHFLILAQVSHILYVL